MIRRNRKGILDELKRIDPEWELADEYILNQRPTIGDVLNLFEAVGIVLGPHEKPEWDGRCHGMTVNGIRCKLAVPSGELYCLTPGHDK